MNQKDMIIQKQFHTVMVPKFTDLEPCTLYQTRLLMGRSGLYIDTKQPFGSLTKCIWESPRELPYGTVPTHDDFRNFLRNQQVRTIFTENIIPDAAINAENNKEWAGWITWNQKAAYEYLPLNCDATATHITVKRPQLPEGTCLAIDVHSHGKIRPFFSSTDNRDDFGGVRLCVVLGSYANDKGKPDFSYQARSIVEGFFFDLHNVEEECES